ncbi:MAG TPA: hypothetical protein VKD90_18805 [Gemmataceae bacterium]|nr:hypothetical protein [Gemmataceae bacterium]
MFETHVIEYEITEEQASAAAEALLDSIGARTGLARQRYLLVQTALYSAFAIGFVALGFWLNQPWWFFVLPCLMLGLLFIVVAIFALVAAAGPWQRRQVDAALREAFRRLESPHIRWTITGDRMTVESGRDVREIEWEDVKDVFLTGSFWIITLEDGPNMLLLADRIPNSTARFLLTRARDVGATIRVAGRPDGVSGDDDENVNIIA